MHANSTYKKFARYYDDYVEHFAEDLAFYKSFCNTGEKILEVGCGTGRVLKSFLEDGFQITGVDISQEMLEVAKEKLSSFYQQGILHLNRHNFLDQPLPGDYDNVLVTFYTFNYILEQPETFLSNIFMSMSENSLLLMDLFYPKTLADQTLNNVWKSREFRYQDRMITLKDKRTFADNIEERIQVYLEDGEETEITTIRKYYPPEAIKELLEAVGFQEIMFSENYEAGNFRERINPEKLTRNFLVNATKGT